MKKANQKTFSQKAFKKKVIRKEKSIMKSTVMFF